MASLLKSSEAIGDAVRDADGEKEYNAAYYEAAMDHMDDIKSLHVDGVISASEYEEHINRAMPLGESDTVASGQPESLVVVVDMGSNEA